MKINQNAERLGSLVQEWLRPDNYQLKEAIDRTVSEGLFSEQDIRFQIRHLKQSVNPQTLSRWLHKSAQKGGELKGRRVLSLHAGNLPLAGFQDILAILLTGADYSGKLSRKDPRILATFLDHVTDKGWDADISYSSDPEELTTEPADAVLFSGSRDRVDDARERLIELGLAGKGTPFLARMAHFSIAHINNTDPETMRDLAEAVFRYGGNGCRSAAMVVAPVSLRSDKCSITDYVEEFWLKNPQHDKPGRSLFHRYAYNRAIGREQSWLDHFLIEESTDTPGEQFVLQWIEGDETRFRELIHEHQNGLQSAYSNSLAAERVDDLIVEPLSTAQRPPIWWKPDGTDVIAWLGNRLTDNPK